MEYGVLGGTGLRVSHLGFGGAPVGLRNYLRAYDPTDAGTRDEVTQAIRLAYDRGVNYFDTAPGYGDGESEAIFGEALSGVDPKRYVLATKTGWNDVKPGDMRRQVENSLKRLGRDYIDVLQFHGSSYPYQAALGMLSPGGLAEQMHALKREGLIRHTGFTTEDNNDAVYMFIRSGLFDVMQTCYNFLFQHPHEPNRPFGSILEAKKAGMGVTAMRPTTSGVFQKWMKQIQPENDFDYTPALIQFALSNPHIDVVLVGMRTPGRVAANVGLCEDSSGRVDIAEFSKYYV